MAEKKAKAPKINLMDATGRMLLLHAKPYKGCMVYIFQIDEELFSYNVIIGGQMYFFHIEVEKVKGQEHLSEAEIRSAVAFVMSGAHATIDTITGQISAQEQLIGKTVIDAGEAAWYSKKSKKGVVKN